MAAGGPEWWYAIRPNGQGVALVDWRLQWDTAWPNFRRATRPAVPWRRLRPAERHISAEAVARTSDRAPSVPPPLLSGRPRGHGADRHHLQADVSQHATASQVARDPDHQVDRRGDQQVSRQRHKRTSRATRNGSQDLREPATTELSGHQPDSNVTAAAEATAGSRNTTSEPCPTPFITHARNGVPGG